MKCSQSRSGGPVTQAKNITEVYLSYWLIWPDKVMGR